MGAEALAAWSVTPVIVLLYYWLEPCPNPKVRGPFHLLSQLALTINPQKGLLTLCRRQFWTREANYTPEDTSLNRGLPDLNPTPPPAGPEACPWHSARAVEMGVERALPPSQHSELLAAGKGTSASLSLSRAYGSDLPVCPLP